MNLQRCYSTVNLKFVRFITSTISDYRSKSHYECLKITPQATQNDVKRAYYELSKQFHPDINKYSQDASEKFISISEAYNVLGNSNKRKLYDRELFLIGNECAIIQNATPEENDCNPYRTVSPTIKTNEKKLHSHVDEWTRIHYSQTFQEAYNTRTGFSIRSREQMQEDDRRMLHVVVLIFVFTIFCLPFKVKPRDTPQ
ncbi:hypothetical protein J6590_053085 [Homalodisca vitripennis]|nr:hypothetical protein J6590_053085 [Homalodisca vitripennis]